LRKRVPAQDRYSLHPWWCQDILISVRFFYFLTLIPFSVSGLAFQELLLSPLAFFVGVLSGAIIQLVFLK